jgi:regulator of RNase E activity RraA
VFARIARPPREVVAALGELESTCLSDAMNRFGGMEAEIRPADPAMRLAGPAITVRVPPGDNLIVYQAMAVAEPGDVIVIEARGFTSVATWGDLTSMIARGRGLVGMVTDGSIRDLRGIRDAGLPVFARPAITPNGARKNGPGEVNVPVAVGGVPVLPGDIIVGDLNGVVVVPRRDAEVVLETARALMAAEEKKVEAILAGELIPEWLPASLQRLGVEIVEAEWDE